VSVKLNTRQVGDVTVVDVAGRVTLGFLPGNERKVDPECGSVQLRNELLGLVSKGKKRVLLNLGQVSYIDAAGIGELVSGFTTITNSGGQLKLLNLTKGAKDLLQVTKLYTVFVVHDDETSAIRSFA